MDDKELSDYREESKMEFAVFLYRILVVVFYFKGRKTKSYKKSLTCFGIYIVTNVVRLILENHM